MKKICLSLCLCLGLGTAVAQVDSQYDKGNIQLINGRVLFQDTVYTTLPVKDAFARAEEWAQQRFTKPNVIVSKFVNNDINSHTISLTAEEYIVFTNRLFVLDRTRINYWVEMQCNEGFTTIKMTRINYWYEEERDGGSKFSAEETITDENAFNKKGTKLLKEQGKFRKGTIDFFDRCVTELSKALTD